MFSPSPSLHPYLPFDPDFDDRFWYWTGASGRRYIHTVYAPRRCPPLRGGVYVAARRRGDERLPIAVGLFCDLWTETSLRPHIRSVDELHVHLLARAPGEAQAVAEDLKAAMKSPAAGPVPPGLAEDDLLPLSSVLSARAA